MTPRVTAPVVARTQIASPKMPLPTGRAARGLRQALIVALISYAALEATVYLCACAGCRVYGVPVPEGIPEGPIVSGSWAVYDPDIGYRWRPAPVRFLRVKAGEILFDVRGYFNNRGFRANHDFTVAKPERTYRFAVLGDSFTAGWNMEKPWPDRLQNELEAKRADRRFQVYSFAQDGSGVPNWHRVFFREIVPNFELDALIIAVWGDNLRRNFIAMTRRQDALYYTTLPPGVTPPASEAELLATHGSSMARLMPVVDEDGLAELRAHLRRWRLLAPDFYFAKYARATQKRVARWYGETRSAAQALPLDPDRRSRADMEAYLTARIGAPRTEMLAEILDHCRAHGVPVIIASVPDVGLLIMRNATGINRHDQLELKQVADAFGTGYFDGYDPYLGLSRESIEELWMLDDPHWNERGAARFASAFAAHLDDQWLRRVVTR